MIGLAKVIPIKNNSNVLNGSKGAYVNVLGYILDRDIFIEEAKKVLLEAGLKVIKFEDIETISERLNSFEVEKYLLDMVNQLNENNKVIFGTFHAY